MGPENGSDMEPYNCCYTLAQLCMAPGDKTVVSFQPWNNDNVSFTRITDQIRRKGRLSFIEAGEEERPRPDDTWLSVEVVGERLDGGGEAVAWYEGVIYIKWRLTKEDQGFLLDGDWSLNSIACRGNNDDDQFIVEVMTNMVWTLAELCATPGDKTVVSFHRVNKDNVLFIRITDQMRRKGRLFFIEEGRPRPDDTWLSVEVYGERLDGAGVRVAWYGGVIHFKQRMTKEDQKYEDWSLNSIVCHGNSDGDKFIVEVMTNMIYEPSLDDLLKTKTSVEFRCALAYFTEDDRAEEDWKLFNDHMSTRAKKESKKGSMLLWMRSGSSYHFFEKLDRNKFRFALDVFAYQKDGAQTRCFSGPVQFSDRTDQLTRGNVNDFVTNKKLQIGVSFSLVTGLPWTNARFGDRWEFNAVKKKEMLAKPAHAPSNRGTDSAEEELEYAEGNDGEDSVEELKKARKSRLKRVKMAQPKGLVSSQSFGSNQRPPVSVEAVAQLSINGSVSYRAISDELIAPPRRYLTFTDEVVPKEMMNKAVNIAGFCREDDIRELFRYRLSTKQNVLWLYKHIVEIAQMSGPGQVLVLKESVRRAMYSMNDSEFGLSLLDQYFTACVMKDSKNVLRSFHWSEHPFLKVFLELMRIDANNMNLQTFMSLACVSRNPGREWHDVALDFVKVWPLLKQFSDVFLCGFDLYALLDSPQKTMVSLVKRTVTCM